MSKSPSQSLACFFLLGVSSLLPLTIPSSAFAQAFKPANTEIPARRRLPPPRASGSCMTGETPLTSLIPGKELGMPLTVQPNPTFYVYVPESSATRYEFALFDGRRPLYKVELDPLATAGVVRIALPDTVALEAGAVDGKPKTYQWFFSIVCDPDDRSSDMTTNGWVHRVNAVFSETSAEALATNGYWYDALDAAYTEGTAGILLESVGLETFSPIPVIE